MGNPLEGKISHVSDKGFGFIAIAGQQKDVFFHAKEVNGTEFANLKVGDEVIFDGIEDSPKGKSAYGVSLK